MDAFSVIFVGTWATVAICGHGFLQLSTPPQWELSTRLNCQRRRPNPGINGSLKTRSTFDFRNPTAHQIRLRNGSERRQRAKKSGQGKDRGDGAPGLRETKSYSVENKRECTRWPGGKALESSEPTGDQNPEERTGKGLTSELETADSYGDIELENIVNCGVSFRALVVQRKRGGGGAADLGRAPEHIRAYHARVTCGAGKQDPDMGDCKTCKNVDGQTSIWELVCAWRLMGDERGVEWGAHNIVPEDYTWPRLRVVCARGN
ncbi:hypothetical protein C8R46DRAFT_1044846 [Mycena filopes]|nr:hypothetical protein C8R46DRAFT_1044846 [Mycena filopes]